MPKYWNFIIFYLVFWLTFNVIELQCRTLGGMEGLEGRSGIKGPQDYSRALEEASQMITDLPYGFSAAFDDASNVFGSVLSKILSKKKFLGIESFFY